MGHRDLWVLEQALNVLAQQHGLATAGKIAQDVNRLLRYTFNCAWDTAPV
jgi:transcriptional regulatory protein LevR